MSQTVEKHPFQAEVSQVLSLVVNSLYTHKEVFLRELVSNASDALDQLNFRALTDESLLGGDATYEIRIAADKEARTLTISDTGVGMDHDQLIANLGTIAHSGTRALIESLSGDQKKDVSLIGQFGVGFYSSFLVADRVEVTSRAAGSDQAWKWESTAEGGFTLEAADRDGRGTDIVLHLREDQDDFLREWTLRELVRKYSDYVRHPILLQVVRNEPVGDEKDEHGNPKETREVVKFERVNQDGALWRRSKSELTDEQYNDFYKHLTHDWTPPLAHTHFKVEGLQEMTGLLFVPGRADMNLYGKKAPGIRLFVKRVFILEDAEELLPEWLRFMRGVVDSEDLPLNVSREFLQKDRTSAGIKKQVVKHSLRLLESLAKEEADELAAATSGESDDDEAEDAEPKRRYSAFWESFGRVLKEGVHFDLDNRERIAKLLRYATSNGDEMTSLEAYVERMAEDQEAIYYVTAENLAAAMSSPHIEGLRARGYEVLYMTDPVDEWVVESLREFDGKKLVSAAKGALDLPDETDEEEAKEQNEAFSGLFERMQGALTDAVKEIRLTRRLTDSPACLVSEDHGLSPHMERLLRANNQPVPEQKRILELNPDHAIVQRLQAIAGDEGRSDDVAAWSQVLYDQALIAEGSPPSDPARFARQVTDLLSRAASH